ncbi:MAG TPA: LUD domain-containing protein [Pseudonocardiaceae bacterium]|nr:LUD domain-containing protein [Pseudonocardiaceae bacterium]
MTDARTDILARIDAALAGRPPAPPVPRAYQRRRDLGDLVELAAERIADYQATVHLVPAGELVTRIGQELSGRRNIVAPAGLPAEWLVPEVSWLVDEPPLPVPELDRADGVLTGCALVIAETGTIVLDAGPDQGRRALTLLPDYHLCVVRADQIVGTVPEAIGRLDPVRPITFISGPSATSDIEFNRVEGVHGPRTLVVLIAV